jgi:asparagine synthase (glutamine-hydrolysing)
MGLPWAVQRVAYSLRQRAGWLERRTPVVPWSEANGSPSRLAKPVSDPGLARARRTSPPFAGAAAVAEEARAGHARFFDATSIEVGFPPRWHCHPETGDEWPRVHWSRLPDMGGSDVKWLWEIGRFGVAYAAVRAWRAAGDDAHAETFWRLVESWRDENPPNCGVHWMCGQECAFRAIAWTFALFGLLDAPATTDERVMRLVEMLAAHGERIEANIGFAVSQKNNHGVNEALGLFTVGSLFPALDRAVRWERKGRDLLEREARRQFYDDGAYVQHSLNYHRLVVQSYAWALRLGELAGRPLSDELRGRYGRAVRFLHQLTDERSGRAPNYGANDGAQLLRLDSCAFEDYRPALALGFWAAERRRVFEPGPWDELLWWLYGDEPLEAPVEPIAREDLAAPEGGYYTLRGAETWAAVRCGTYRDRPAQADMLHVDVWWRGHNLVADPGTYAYNGPAPWNNGLARTDVHNAVSVDGLDQMERGPRFTWFHWTRGRVVRRESLAGGRVKLFEGEHEGFARRAGVVHRRAVLLVDDRMWVVVDDLLGEGEHDLSAQWLFPGARVVERAGARLRLETPVGPCAVAFAGGDVRAAEGDAATTLGWFSPKYRYREPALALVAGGRSSLPARRVTVVSLGEDVAVEEATVARLVAGGLRAEWRPFPYRSSDSLVAAVGYNG